MGTSYLYMGGILTTGKVCAIMESGEKIEGLENLGNRKVGVPGKVINYSISVRCNELNQPCDNIINTTLTIEQNDKTLESYNLNITKKGNITSQYLFTEEGGVGFFLHKYCKYENETKYEKQPITGFDVISSETVISEESAEKRLWIQIIFSGIIGFLLACIGFWLKTRRKEKTYWEKYSSIGA